MILTSGFGALSWNWMIPIFAFSIRVGPPAALTTVWLRTTPSTSSVSSIVPPTFLTTRMSRRSTLEDVGVTRRVTADTAIGARVEEYWDTIYTRTDVELGNAHEQGHSYLRVKGSCRGTQQSGFVFQVYWRRELFKVFDRFGGCLEEGFSDDSRVNALLQHPLCSTKKTACQDDDGCRSVTGLNILGRGQVDQLQVHFNALSTYVRNEPTIFAAGCNA